MIEQNELSRGLLDYPYVLQFANTTPFVYEIQQMLLYDMGITARPPGTRRLRLGSIAALAHAEHRLDHRRDLAGGVFCHRGERLHQVQSLHATRLRAACDLRRLRDLRLDGLGPESPPAGAASLSSGRIPGRMWWRALWLALAAGVLAASLLFTLGMDSIYSTNMTRVVASEWIYNHIPAGDDHHL